jgi:hypothetical protein
MKVRCKRILFARGVGAARLEKEGDTAITIGGEYMVVMIDLRATGLYFHVIDDQEQMSSWLFDMFEVTDGRLASSWRINIGEDGSFVVGPERWTRPGFWREWDRGTREALDLYEEELAKIREDA